MWKWFKSLLTRDVRAIRSSYSFEAGMFVHEDTAMKVSAYYRGLMYISTQIAKLPWHVKDANNKILVNDPVGFLLDLCPNDEVSAFNFKLALVQNAIHHGNGYAEIVRDMVGRPKALYFIPSESVSLWRTPKGELIYRITEGSVSTPGMDAYLYPRDMFHIKNFHTKDGYAGQGLVAYAGHTLGISLAADQTAGNLFSNGGLPSGVLEVEGSLSDESFERIRKSWAENHKGKKTGGTAILESGVSYKPISMSPDVMQFLESRKFGIYEIARFLGLPPTKLFDVTAATFNNVENSNLEVATDTLDAWAKNLEMEADIKLLNKRHSGKHTEIDLYQIFRGDMTTRANYFSKMLQAAALNPSEIREWEGLPTYPGGDRYFLATNNLSPIDRVDEVLDAQIAKDLKASEPKEAPPAAPEEKELTNAALKFLRGGN